MCQNREPRRRSARSSVPALRKMGSGKLTVDNAAGADSRIYVDNGTLVLKGVDAAALEPSLPGGTVLHLDATQISGADTREET